MLPLCVQLTFHSGYVGDVGFCATGGSELNFAKSETRSAVSARTSNNSVTLGNPHLSGSELMFAGSELAFDCGNTILRSQVYKVSLIKSNFRRSRSFGMFAKLIEEGISKGRALIESPH